ncbi:MAG TPA: hypothetical protein VGV38_06695, partial [Pyrinomonadaceae bacterium]|nr:hypothetical protein [Pyrinomonadaceae bacterium]
MSLTADLKNFRPGDAERIALLGRALAAAFACGLLLSFKLWVSTRQYPLSPALGLLPAFAFPLDYLSLAALLALLGASAFAARPRPFLLSLLALSLLLCLQDQTRWQPWVYQYLFMLAALALHDGRGASDARRRAAVDACRLVVAGVYFWSGLQKLNANFFGEIWPWVVGPYAQHLPGAAGRGLSAAGILVPLAEVFVGVGLLTRRLRTTAVVLALATHAAVLALFAPLGRNAVVWPWNVASGVFVFVLFWRARET